MKEMSYQRTFSWENWAKTHDKMLKHHWPRTALRSWVLEINPEKGKMAKGLIQWNTMKHACDSHDVRSFSKGNETVKVSDDKHRHASKCFSRLESKYLIKIINFF